MYKYTQNKCFRVGMVGTEILGKFWKRFNPHVLIILTSPLLARKALPQGGTWVWLNLATPQSLAWLVAYIFANFGLEKS